MMQLFYFAAGFVACILLARILIQTSNRVKAIKNQVGRLSMTFLKIENDIDAIHKSLIELARDDTDKQRMLIKLRERRKKHFQTIVENGPDVPEILRGLEEPDIDDDPNYWKNRRDMFNFKVKE